MVAAETTPNPQTFIVVIGSLRLEQQGMVPSLAHTGYYQMCNVTMHYTCALELVTNLR